MSVGSRIKELREDREMTRNELAKKLNITVGAISNYENGVSSPKEPILFKLMEVLECDANYLFQDVVNIKSKNNDISLSELKHLNKYRKLEHSRKNKIDKYIDIELEEQQDYNKKQYLKVARGKGEELVSDEDIDKMIENSTKVKGDDDLV